MPVWVRGSLSDSIDRLLAGLPELDREINSKVSKFMIDTVQDLTPVSELDYDDPHHRPGRLRAGWRVNIRGGTVKLSNKVPYAKYVEFDTRPHIIEPKKASALRFRTGGDLVFTKRVHHPGTTGHYMLTKTMGITERNIERLCAGAIAKWKRNAGYR